VEKALRSESIDATYRSLRDRSSGDTVSIDDDEVPSEVSAAVAPKRGKKSMFAIIYKKQSRKRLELNNEKLKLENWTHLTHRQLAVR
jgi:hypothetical protein